MTAAVELELDVACHCALEPAGHPLEACGTRLTRVAVRPFSAGPASPAEGRSWTRDGKHGGNAPMRPYSASGTCPACGRPGVRVAAAQRRGAVSTVRNAVHRVPLGIDLELAAHRRPGRGAPPCLEGPGRPPAETTFTRSPRIAEWAAEYGPEAVR